VNQSQIDNQRRQLNAEAAEVDALLADAVAKKSFNMLADLEERVGKIAADRAELDRAESVSKAAGKFAAVMAHGADQADGPVIEHKGIHQKGRDVSPLAFTENSMRTMHKAIENRTPVSVKAFSTIDSLLPAELSPLVIGKVHERRLLDRLPAMPVTAPSYEFIVHSSSTGAPAVTAEGATKPDVVLNGASSIAAVVKLAATFGISHETLADWPQWLSYANTEMVRQIEDLENNQLLNGSGTGGNVTGFLNTSGILTHAVTTETALDAVEMSIAQLRTGSALAEADLLVLNPATWSAMRRIKTTYGSYIVNPDPTEGAGDQLWGVPVLVTTQLAAGAGVLLDTTRFGKVLVRDGITVKSGYTNDDFSRNITRFVIEERLTLAVERPSAVLAISGLPTS
jgi:HK97 family phage major capsid protein